MLRSKLLFILPLVVCASGQSDNRGYGYYGTSNVRDQRAYAQPNAQPIYRPRPIPLPPRPLPGRLVPQPIAPLQPAEVPIPEPVQEEPVESVAAPVVAPARVPVAPFVTPASQWVVTSEDPITVPPRPLYAPRPILRPVVHPAPIVIQSTVPAAPPPVGIFTDHADEAPAIEPVSAPAPVLISEPAAEPEPELASEPKPAPERESAPVPPRPIYAPRPRPLVRPIVQPAPVIIQPTVAAAPPPVGIFNDRMQGSPAFALPASEPAPVLIAEPAVERESEPVFEEQPAPQPEPVLVLEPAPAPLNVDFRPIPAPEPELAAAPEPAPVPVPEISLAPIAVPEPALVLEEKPAPQPEPALVLEPAPAPLIVDFRPVVIPAGAEVEPPSRQLVVVEPEPAPLPEPAPALVAEPEPAPVPEPVPAPLPENESVPEIEIIPVPLEEPAPEPQPTVALIQPAVALPAQGGALPPLLPKRKPIREPAFGRHPTDSPADVYYPTRATPAPYQPLVVSTPKPVPAIPTGYVTRVPTVVITPRVPPVVITTRAPPVEETTRPAPLIVTSKAPAVIMTPKSPPVTNQIPPRPFGSLKLDFVCKDGNGYYAIENECDAYIQCTNDRAIKYICPDGLHFNPIAQRFEYPCAYPSQVKCIAGAAKQPANPTNQCPRQYGFFAMNDGDCSKYIMCQEGAATIMDCPPGLAFNQATDSCDWPENVPQCNPNVFRDFTCPSPPLDENGLISDVIVNYRYQNQCKLYVACQRGHPRLLSCERGLSFDEASQRCIDDEYVTNCALVYSGSI